MAIPEKCADCGRLIHQHDSVTLSVEEYKELLNASEKQARHLLSHNQLRRLTKSPIARNPELADFLIRGASTKTLEQIATDCRRRFGEHAPSQSAIHRFLKALNL